LYVTTLTKRMWHMDTCPHTQHSVRYNACKTLFAMCCFTFAFCLCLYWVRRVLFCVGWRWARGSVRGDDLCMQANAATAVPWLGKQLSRFINNVTRCASRGITDVAVDCFDENVLTMICSAGWQCYMTMTVQVSLLPCFGSSPPSLMSTFGRQNKQNTISL
jgi:hypothetical protein